MWCLSGYSDEAARRGDMALGPSAVECGLTLLRTLSAFIELFKSFSCLFKSNRDRGTTIDLRREFSFLGNEDITTLNRRMRD